HRVRTPTVGAPGRGTLLDIFLLFPFDLQGWRADPSHFPWAPRIRSQRDTRFGSGVLSSGQPATFTSWSSSRPDATPTLRLHQPGATGARASAHDKCAWSGVGRHASAPPWGLRFACRSSASWLTEPP